MGSDRQAPSSPRPGGAWLAFVVASLAGVGLSIYLTYVHAVVTFAGEKVEGLCNLSSRINCNVAAGSQFSEVGGIPIALIGLGFYLGTLLILLLFRKSGDKFAPHILLALYGGAVLYSLFLGGVSAFILQSFCWACTSLYLVNILGLLLARALVGQPYGAALKELFGNIGRVAPSPVAFGFVVTMIVAVVAGTALVHQLGQGLKKTDAEHLAEAEAWVLEEFSRTPSLTPAQIKRLHGTGHAKGAEGDKALVTIAEFSDFECPFCSRVAPDLMKIIEDPLYKGKVRVVFHHNPLDMACNKRLSKPFHQHACQAAKVAICAEEQGQFWPMHDRLFENQRALGPEHAEEHARALSLNVKELTDCVASGRPDAVIQADVALAKDLDVKGTPTLFINGRLVRGAVPFWKMKAALDHELRGAAGTP